jgi:hypothetical protein
MSPAPRASLTAILLATNTGCTSVRPVLAPDRFIPQQRPELVWVLNERGDVVPLAQPRVETDSLFGTWEGLGEPVAMKLGDVREVRARQPDRTKTALLVAALVGGAGLVYWGAAQGHGPEAQCVIGMGGRPVCS